MKVKLYEETKAFAELSLPLLLKQEAENNLLIGILLRLAKGEGWSNEPPRFWTVEENGKPVAVAIQTPPFKVILMAMRSRQVEALAETLHAAGLSLPGALGPQEVTKHFAERWAILGDCKTQQAMALGIYQLDKVRPVDNVPGRCEEATMMDYGWLCDWMNAFQQDVHTQRTNSEQEVRKWIERKQLLLWKAPMPVSMACAIGETPNGIRISGVYTPPKFRKAGYATANVAALSSRQLKAGRKFCYLFTDLANPVSNRIYRKIGYRQVSEYAEYKFQPVTELAEKVYAEHG